MAEGTKYILRPVDRLPLPLMAAALVAMTALYFTADRVVGLPVAAVLLLASYATAWRFSRDRVLRWVLRVVAVAGIVLVVGIPEEDMILWYLKPAYTNLIGYVLSAELVLRAWERQDPTHVRISYGFVLFTTAMVMTAASHSYDRTAMAWLAPAYFLCLLTCMRSFAALGHAPVADAGSRRRSLAALRTAATALALGVGFVGVYTVTRMDNTIIRWVSDLLHSQRPRRTEIGLSNAPQLRGRFNPDASASSRVMLIDGPRSELHLRAAAFDTYERLRWKPTVNERKFESIAPASLRTAGREGGHVTHAGIANAGAAHAGPAYVGAARYGVTRLGDTLGLLPVPLNALAIEPTGDVDRDEAGALRDHGSASSRYEFVVPTDERAQGPLCIPPSAADRERLLQFPAEVDARVRALASDVAGAGTPSEKLIRIGRHLNSNHAYSLSFEPRGEPISDFVLNARAAHCQYFASAYVMMARAVGIPARYVSGFYAHEAYGEDQTVVRDRDAHAWAECYIDGVGWLTVDATPSGGLPVGLFPETSPFQRLRERISDIPRVVRHWLTEEGGNRVVIVSVLSIGAVAASIHFLRIMLERRKRRRADISRYATPSEELARVGERFERLLGRRGVDFAPTRTWRDHLDHADPGKPDPLDPDASRAFIDLYDQARFGGKETNNLPRVRRAIEALEKSDK